MLSFINFFVGGGIQKQWTVLRHNGPMFPPEYEPHKTPIIVDNKKIILPPLAEEYATLFTKYLDTKYMNINNFKKNFWKDFKPTLPNNLNIKNLEEIDFSLIKKYLDEQKEKKSQLTKEEKAKKAELSKKEDEPFMYCIVDGSQQSVGNYKIEPPGIFLGRGSHPKIGRIKKRIYPEDVTLNLDKEAPKPKTIDGHKWGSIIHDHTVIWLATWKDNITGKSKYIFTSLDSFFKAKSDEDKFDLARKLKRKINTIRESYEHQLNNDDMKMRQLATALYFIDNLALRVGGKKDSKEQADTVGVTSLRVEHITFFDNHIIKLDFLGKDSVRYCRKVTVHKDVYDNLKLFIKNKSNKEELFELITSSTLNEYLDSFMKGLTAKVWRTYNASFIFQKELDKLTSSKKIDLFTEKEERLNFLITIFNQANTEVALLCNHQKSVTTNLDKSIDVIDTKLKLLKNKKRKYKGKKNEEKLINVKKKIHMLILKKESKLKMKNVSLGTSKQNYIDPRIIFAFANKYEIPPERLLNPKLIVRFQWASKVDSDFRF
jgi:DNA topoisomerase I